MNNNDNMTFRMVELQIMNIVNVGISEELFLKDIYMLGEAIINATQLFLNEQEVYTLRKELKNRIDSNLPTSLLHVVGEYIEK